MSKVLTSITEIDGDELFGQDADDGESARRILRRYVYHDRIKAADEIATKILCGHIMLFSVQEPLYMFEMTRIDVDWRLGTVWRTGSA